MADTYDVILRARMEASEAITGIGTIKKALNELSLPKGIADGLTKQFDKLNPLLKDYQRQLDKNQKGFKSPIDIKNLEMLRGEIDGVFNEINGQIKQINGQPIILKADAKEITNLEKQLSNAKANLQKAFDSLYQTKYNPTKTSILSGLDQFSAVLPKTTTRVKSMVQDVVKSFSSGNFALANDQIEQLKNRFDQLGDSTKLKIAQDLGLVKIRKDAEITAKVVDDASKKVKNFLSGSQTNSKAANDIKQFSQEVTQASSKLEQFKTDALTNGLQKLSASGTGLKQINTNLQQTGRAATDAGSGLLSMQQQVDQLKTSTQYFFGLRNMLNLFKQGVRQAVQSVKELDAAMTETAVVTEFSVSDMWEKLPQYTKNANELGATIQDMYESTTLYYQQGLNTDQSMTIAAETMKMARIGGLEAAEATDMMTAALRGFNMELSEVSAQRINDVYSQLAAKTASNTKELGTAMQRTASIANSAGMSFEGTAAFLAQAIETTREPAENIGTAMKTIVARFQEMKQNPLELVDVEGEEVSYNRVDTALQTIGVTLKDTNGQFRALDEVFLDISSRWDNLTQTQQRYIATTAAGSRQQSRFIAMMDNYKRVTQLMDYANNSAGASQEQFNKTLESFQAKANKLKNAWQEFTMNIANNTFVKGAVDGLTEVISLTNKLIEVVSGGNGLVKSVLSLGTAFIGLKMFGRGANALIGGLGGLVDPQSSFLGGLKNSIGVGRNQLQADRISNPIVQAIYSLIPHIDGQVDLSNKLYRYQENGNFKQAREQIWGQRGKGGLGLGLKGKGTYTIDQLTNIFDSNQLNKEQQKLMLKSMPGLRNNLTKALTSLYNQVGMDSKVSQGLIAGFKKGTLTLDEALKQPELTTTLAKRRQEIANDSGKKAARDYYKAQRAQAIQEAKAQGITNTKAQLKYAQQYQVLTKEAEQFTKNQTQQLTRNEQVANSLGSAGGALMGFGSTLQMVGAQIGQTNAALGQLVATLGSTLTSVGSLATALPALIAGGAPVIAMTAAVTALGVAIGATAYKSHKIKQSAKEVTDTFKKTHNDIENNIASLQDYRDELAILSKGVDKNGNNINLDNADYKRYLEITDAIAKMNPEIVKGYNAQGHAIIDNNKALEKTLKIQQEQQQKAIETYTKPESLQKLIAARDINKGFTKATTFQQRTTLSTLSSAYDEVDTQATPMTSAVSNIGKELKQEKWFDEKTLKQYGIESLDALIEGREDAVQNYIRFEDKIATDLSEAAAKSTDGMSSGLTKSLEKYTVQKKDFDDAVAPLGDALTTYASNLPIFKNLGTEFKDSILEGVRGIANTPGLTGKEMQYQTQQYIQQFDALTNKNSEYARAMKIAEEAQENFADSLDVAKYTEQSEKAIVSLDSLLNQYKNDTTATGQAIKEFLENQKAQIQNFTEDGSISLSESLNTMTNEITNANSALDSFTEATKTDFSTGAENMKSIFEKITEESESGVKLHMEGKGDQTLWEGARHFFSEQKLLEADGPEAVQKMLNRITPMLEEGQAGFDTFWTDLLGHEQDLNKIKGVSMDAEKGLFNFDDDINPDVFTEIANALGYSEEFLTSMLQKGRQFADINFTDVSDVRKALSTDESAIKGTSTSTVTNDSGKKEEVKDMYVKESYLRNALTEAEIVTPADQKSEIENLEKEGIKIIPSADSITKTDFKNLGINDIASVIKTFGDTGQFDKNEIQEYAKQLEGENFSEDQFNTEYDAYMASLEPGIAEQNATLHSLDATVSSIATSLFNDRIEQGHLDQSKIEQSQQMLFGSQGVDTEAQYFALGQNGKGDKLSQGEFDTISQNLNNYITESQEYVKSLKTGLTEAQQRGDYEEASQIQKEIDAYTNSENGFIPKAQEYLQSGTEAYNKTQTKEKEKKEEERRSTDIPVDKPKDSDRFNPFSSSYDPLLSKEEEKRRSTDIPISELRDSTKMNPFSSSFQPSLPKANSNVDQGLFNLGIDLTTDGAEAFKKGAKQGVDKGGTGAHKTIEESSKKKSGEAFQKVIKGLKSPAVKDGKLVQDTKKKGDNLYRQVTNGLKDAGGKKIKVPDSIKQKASNIWEQFVNNVKDSAKTEKTVNIPKTHSSTQSKKDLSKDIEVKPKVDDSPLNKVKKTITNIFSKAKKAATIKVNAKVSPNLNKASKDIDKILKKGKKTTTVGINAKVNGKKNVSELNNVISQTKPKKVSISATTGNSISKVSSLRSEINALPSSKTITITTIKETKHRNGGNGGSKDGNGDAIGKNNHIAPRPTPTFGSLAKGSKNGRLGPKGKGGLTLTGEEGFEIAWLPSQSKSMVLGINGPQMLNLPSDAVVYNHEQSKEIIKQKSVSAGSLGTGTVKYKPKETTTPTVNVHVTADPKPSSSNSSGSKGSKGKDKDKGKGKGKEKDKKNDKEEKTSKKIANTWDIISRRVAAAERNADKVGKKLEAVFNDIRANISDVQRVNKKYYKSQQQSIKLNTTVYDKYNKALKNLDKGKGKSGKFKVKYEKGGKKKKTVTEKVSSGSFVKQDPETGAYYLDEKALNRKYKNKNKRKAVKEETLKRIDDYTDKRNNAEDKRDEAQDNIAKYGKEINNTFFGWKNELTEVLRVTKEIEKTEAKLAITRAKQELAQSKISQIDTSKGLLGASDTFLKGTKNAFSTSVGDELLNLKNNTQTAISQIDDEIGQKRELQSAYQQELKENGQLSTSKNSYTYFDIDKNKQVTTTEQARYDQIRTLDDEVKNTKTLKKRKTNAKKRRDELKKKAQKNPQDKKAQQEYKDAQKEYERTDKEYNDRTKAEDAVTKAENKVKKAKTKKQKAKAKKELKKAKANLKKNKNKNVTQRGSGEWWNELSDNDKEIYARGEAFKQGYIKQNKDGSYTIDPEKIKQDKKNGKITTEQANLTTEIFSRLTEGYNNSLSTQADILSLQKEQLEEEGNYKAALEDVRSTFFDWENTLTRVLQLTNQIEQAEKRISLLKAADEMYRAQAEAGHGKNTQQLAGSVLASYQAQLTSIGTNLQSRQELLGAQKQELNNLLTGNDIQSQIDNLNTAKSGASAGQQEIYQAQIDKLNKDKEIRELAQKYVQTTQLSDGTVSVKFDTAGLDRDKGTVFDAATGAAIEEYANKLTELSGQIQDTTAQNVEDITTLYQSLVDLKKQDADNAKELREAYGAQQQKQIDQLKSLNDSIDNHFKNLISLTKEQLTQRRQAEDNEKTERDISKKQQRLSVLRANTSGGNQVEIAKLEQEVADAQQSYGRTLEDQLLDKISRQGDEAAQQRQRQIELMQGQRDIAAKTGRDAALIQQWLSNPEGYRGAITTTLKEQENWDSLTTQEKTNLEGVIDNKFVDYSTVPKKIKDVQDEVNALGPIFTKVNEQLEATQKAADEAKAEAAKAATPVAAPTTNTGGGGGGGGQGGGGQGGGGGGQGGGGGGGQTTQQKAEKAYNDALAAVRKKKTDKVTKTDVNDLFTKGSDAGKGKARVLSDLLGDGSPKAFKWKSLFHAIIDADGINRYNLVKTWPNGTGTLEEAIKTLKSKPNTFKDIKKAKEYTNAKALKFKTGGLADFTGPAWLDGTSSKPELVLNAQDTKNFLALKDVLSRVMGSVNTIGDKYDGGNTTYEININVDKIEKDYDVDRMADRIKKIIVRDASYRNVTQVSRLR